MPKIEIISDGTANDTHLFIDGEEQKLVHSIYFSTVANNLAHLELLRLLEDEDKSKANDGTTHLTRVKTVETSAEDDLVRTYEPVVVHEHYIANLRFSSPSDWCTVKSEVENFKENIDIVLSDIIEEAKGDNNGEA